jgi:HEAT repeat protein
VPVIIQRSSHKIQQIVLEVIVHMSQQDIGPLEKIAEQHGEEMGENLLVILNRLKGEQVNTMLFKMCSHSSNIVRRKAIKELFNRDPKYAQQLFSLIDDPNKLIRSYILAAIGKHKSIPMESKLLNYLKENAAKKDPGHILACYEALGRCGSNNIVPFLSDILMGRGWNSFMGSGKLFFREGAAIALAWLDTPEAKAVLQKASKSRFKVIRDAFDRTKSIRAVAGEYTHD